MTVRHEPARGRARATTACVRILRLVLTILFSYSSFPLRLAAARRLRRSRRLSFLLGAFYLVRGLFGDTHVPGWTTIVVLLSVFNGFTIALLSMLGEYVVRTLNAVSAQDTYHVDANGCSGVTRHLLVIGAQRCGTTYLHDLLDAHPEIAMARPARPEPKVFLADELAGARPGLVPRDLLRARHRPSRARREEHQLPRGPRGRRPGRGGARRRR